MPSTSIELVANINEQSKALCIALRNSYVPEPDLGTYSFKPSDVGKTEEKKTKLTNLFEAALQQYIKLKKLDEDASIQAALQALEEQLFLAFYWASVDVKQIDLFNDYLNLAGSIINNDDEAVKHMTDIILSQLEKIPKEDDQLKKSFGTIKGYFVEDFKKYLSVANRGETHARALTSLVGSVCDMNDAARKANPSTDKFQQVYKIALKRVDKSNLPGAGAKYRYAFNMLAGALVSTLLIGVFVGICAIPGVGPLIGIMGLIAAFKFSAISASVVIPAVASGMNKKLKETRSMDEHYPKFLGGYNMFAEKNILKDKSPKPSVNPVTAVARKFCGEPESGLGAGAPQTPSEENAGGSVSAAPPSQIPTQK